VGIGDDGGEIIERQAADLGAFSRDGQKPRSTARCRPSRCDFNNAPDHRPVPAVPAPAGMMDVMTTVGRLQGRSRMPLRVKVECARHGRVRRRGPGRRQSASACHRTPSATGTDQCHCRWRGGGQGFRFVVRRELETAAGGVEPVHTMISGLPLCSRRSRSPLWRRMTGRASGCAARQPG